MRSYNPVIFCAFIFTILIVYGHAENLQRQKRFLRRDILNPLSDGLFGLGDYARDFTDQIASQATMAVRHVMPQATRAVNGLSNWGSRLGEQVVDGMQKRGLIRVPIEREIEGDEKEVEVFNPEETEPQRPTPGGGNRFNPYIPFQFTFGILTPWWDGPNVCVERNEIEEPEQETTDMPGFSINFETTRCVPSESTYSCTRKIQTNGMRKTVVIRRQCCHGFVRRTDGRPGCSALKMEDLLETMKSLERTKFVKWIESAGLEDKLKTGNYTIFTPSNEAIIDFEDDSEDNEISAINPAKRLIDTSSIVAGHIVEGFENIDVLENEQELKTLGEGSKIRINKYQPAHEVVTANCVPISGKNNFATNGMAHLTSDVLPQPKKNLAEIIEEDEGFTKFKNLLIDSGIMEDLKKQDQPWTLFVPTDSAFRKLPKSLKKQIESGEGCIQSILLEHVVKGTLCTAAVVSQVRVKNILDNYLQLTKDEAEKLRINGALVDSENILGTNGVIHVIDKVLIPPQARNLLKALEEDDRQDLLELLELSEMVSQLEDAQNVTFFAPSKEAIKSLSNETREEMMSDPEFLKKVLQHHLVPSHTPSNNFMDNKKLTTLNGHNVHIKLHETFPGLITAATVQCAYIVNHDNQACGAVIHKINKVLMPPKGSIVEALKHMEDHEIVLKLLQNTDLETKLAEDGPFTFLAPTDEAFEKMRDMTVEDLQENNTLAEKVLKLHILPEVLCCNGVSHSSPFHRQYVRTLDGSVVPTYRGLSERVRFGRAKVTKCDVPATNGLVHSINRVILPERPRSPTLFGMDLWPFF
ncbi:transforming growth factor-beta-induced protein ig-h3 [Trichonephila clavata]|uniref:Transforming growth factor-beta-induced protein ig-h3 n=1 Tax=Trichonephila clavata TaxID=2740835 RepID=A0A8X6HW75_TRICU|nr:transforming growth factor-beta-induced protein ig-h3 [Trichonephila clavata]